MLEIMNERLSSQLYWIWQQLHHKP